MQDFCQDVWSHAISTYAVATAANSSVHTFNLCNFVLRHFQPITLPPNYSQTAPIIKPFLVISNAIKRGYMSFRPMQFQPLSFQPIRLSTCNSNHSN